MSSNFLQWDPAGTNMESDSQYAADAQRSGGAGVGSLFSSAAANKLFHQLSTFIAAFAQMMAAKGYTVSDANLANLQGVLASVMTQADMGGFAPKASPVFTGNPIAPNPPVGDDSQSIATTHWVRGSALPSFSGYLTLPNGMMMQWLAGPWQPADGSEPFDQQAWPTPFVHSPLNCQISMEISGPTTAMDSWYQIVGFNNNVVQYQRQHGDSGSYQAQTRALIFAIGY